jgi:hypothetical protein
MALVLCLACALAVAVPWLLFVSLHVLCYPMGLCGTWMLPERVLQALASGTGGAWWAAVAVPLAWTWWNQRRGRCAIGSSLADEA